MKGQTVLIDESTNVADKSVADKPVERSKRKKTTNGRKPGKKKTEVDQPIKVLKEKPDFLTDDNAWIWAIVLLMLVILAIMVWKLFNDIEKS